MSPRTAHRSRGSALLTVMIMMGILLSVTAALLYYAGEERRRAISQARAIPRNYCAETGLQIARDYFGSNFKNWKSFLSQPSYYDPTAISPRTPSDPFGNAAAIKAFDSHLFADLDGDGQDDVYIYVHDDQDEFTTANDPSNDNNQVVIIGAVCISKTMVPRLQNGKVDSAAIAAEALLSYEGLDSKIAQRCGSGGSSNGLCNANQPN